MEENTQQVLVALTFIFLGIFVIVDQVSIYLGLDLAYVVRPLFLLAGILAFAAGVTLLMSLQEG